MGTHTKRSPSKAKRTIKCWGNYALCDTLPAHQRNVGSEAARIGTVVHALIERCLQERAQPADFIDWIVELVGTEENARWHKPTAKEPSTGNRWYIIDDDMIDGATVCTDYARRRCEELGVPESALQLESRTNPLPDRDDTSGTADITIDAWPAVLEVADYKNGGIVVDHVNNDQAIAYLLGKALEDGFAHETYITTIIQPNAAHEDGKVRTFELTRDELVSWQMVYLVAILGCEEAEAAFEEIVSDSEFAEWSGKYLHAGDHCTFCEAQPVCEARRKMVQDHARMDFAKEPKRLGVDRDRLAQILRWAPEIDNFLRRTTAFAQREMENGHTVIGQKLVERGSVRKLRADMSQSEIVEAIVFGGFVADTSRLYRTKLKTGPQIEKLVDRKRRKEFNDEFLTRPPGKRMVAPIDDPRPAIKCSAADDFDAWSEADESEFG